MESVKVAASPQSAYSEMMANGSATRSTFSLVSKKNCRSRCVVASADGAVVHATGLSTGKNPQYVPL